MTDVTNHNPETFLESLDPNRVEVIEVHCPYCFIGTAATTRVGPTVITVGTRQSVDMNPLQCNACRRWFRIGFKQEFVGIRMEGTK